MPCSMLKGPFVSGVRQQLWPRKYHHFPRTETNWCLKPAAQRAINARGGILASGRHPHSAISGNRKNWSLRRAVEGSSQISTNGDVRVRGDEEEERRSEPLEAILVLAGGQLPEGGVPVWVERRLDKALQLQKLNGPECRIVCLGNGTPHRRPILTPEGFVIHESSSCAEYLINQGAPVSVLLKEWGSYDTIGNAYFALTQHVIPRRWRRLAVVTSDFHMPRSHAIFEWVFGLQGADTSIRSQRFMLQYHDVSDNGIDASIIQARIVKERKALESLKILSPGINTLSDFHMWFHTQHKCYNVEHQGLFGKEPLDDPALWSY